MAVDYSFVITWSYFSAYALIFFISSVVCTIEVYHEKQDFKRRRSSAIQDVPPPKYQHVPTKSFTIEDHNSLNQIPNVTTLEEDITMESMQNKITNKENIIEEYPIDQQQNMITNKNETTIQLTKSSSNTKTDHTAAYKSVNVIDTLEQEETNDDETISGRVINLEQEAKQFTYFGLFKLWSKLFLRKKKVYFQLVPHFFDQATDFGVIFEYYRYSQSEQDIGINVKALFWVSIAVLIVHRIVSSAAIYKLTKKPIDVLLQLFDFLMIRCVWTNYKLGIDEPSNAQRYLQTLEATFEV